MNGAQSLWWQQAKSDLSLFQQLRKAGVSECQQLHYLQMVTEKLSKAYLWRSGKPTPKSHTGFVRLLKALLDQRPKELEGIAKAFVRLMERVAQHGTRPQAVVVQRTRDCAL